MERAIIVKDDNGLCEVRCANCGKLLCTFKKIQKKGKNNVDKSLQMYYTICTRL